LRQPIEVIDVTQSVGFCASDLARHRAVTRATERKMPRNAEVLCGGLLFTERTRRDWFRSPLGDLHPCAARAPVASNALLCTTVWSWFTHDSRKSISGDLGARLWAAAGPENSNKTNATE